MQPNSNLKEHEEIKDTNNVFCVSNEYQYKMSICILY